MVDSIWLPKQEAIGVHTFGLLDDLWCYGAEGLNVVL